jgi:putative DNA primase/helicase
VDIRLFAGFSADADKFQYADLRSKRLVFAAEVRPGSRMNEHVLKHITGGETLRGEFKYGAGFTFHPCCKIWLGVNHRPKVVDESFGFWSRVRLIPFQRTFTGSAEDMGLRDTLRAEAAGILAWVVDGCLKWQQKRLKGSEPASVQHATLDYQQSEDPLGDFFDACVTSDETTVESRVLASKLYGVYRAWAEGAGIPKPGVLTLKAFGSTMATRPFLKGHTAKGTEYQGLALKSSLSYDPPQDPHK